MPLIDIKPNPTRNELRVFAGLWLLFFLILGRAATWKPGALLIAASLTATAWLVSLAFNRDFPRRTQLMGALIPLGLLTIGGVEHLGASPRSVEHALWAVALLGATASLLSPSIARALYTNWMRAAVPLGWTFSHLLLALIYYTMLTPIGLVLRLRGHDPMQRRFDPSRSTYWSPRPTAPHVSRYFRQF